MTLASRNSDLYVSNSRRRPFLCMLLRFVYERRDASAFRRGDRPIGRFPAPTSRQTDLHTLGGSNPMLRPFSEDEVIHRFRAS